MSALLQAQKLRTPWWIAVLTGIVITLCIAIFLIDGLMLAIILLAVFA